MYLKKNNNVRPKGTKLILSKGRLIKINNPVLDIKKNWNNQLYVLISTISIKKKIFGLIKYANGALSYVPLSHGFFLGDMNYTTNLPAFLWHFNKPGMAVLLFFLKKFSIFNNLIIKNKAKYATSSGTFCQIIEIFEDLAIARIKLPSGKEKIVSTQAFATLGRNANLFANCEVYGKAGYMLNKGIKPKVRGVAMNPVDHPHGGRTKTNKPEVSPWGWVTKNNK